MSDFQTKRQARIERLEQRAEKMRAKSDALHEQANDMESVIPMGQPILVGHHSEKADRAYRKRIQGKLHKAFALQDYANELERRAQAAKLNTAIFADDPDAAEKLETKIARLEQRQDLMTVANKLIRRGDRDALRELGFDDARIEQLFQPDFLGRIGFPDYKIKNNGANIRRLKRRLEQVNFRSQQTDTETIIGRVRILDNVQENRVQIFFPAKPADEIRTELKRHGFKWAPSTGCWQAYRGPNATYWANRIVRAHEGIEEE